MFDIYRSCAVCLVLPGGLGRLIDPTERSTWAQRAWTLQEAIAPPVVLVVFQWKFSDWYLSHNCEPVGTIEPFHSEFSDHEQDMVEIRFRMQTITRDQAYLLWLTREASKPNDLSEVNSDKLQVALWKATWIRSSSRPVDMVFSIMGLFGVSLDPSRFHRDDRVGATLALASAALQKGSSAAWLGAYLELNPCPFMSSFPSIPNTSESGGCTIRTATGFMNVEDLAFPLVRSEEGSSSSANRISAQNGAWVLDPSNKGHSRYYAITIGRRAWIVPGEEPCLGFADPIVLIIVKRHSTKPDLFHRISHASVTNHFIANWGEYEFAIGGPNKFGS
ncbi:hypothetical protein BO83DRAFT_406203 [Aspergillus eucalypticola CBS 122712]|uniref:Heterokaryon incompatibility domain-containing protein n=1 Tax=Aspergillus eucalypticola (strain CBS 122712 / IBT 29274) TaxID=1448314 RepID=A0A317W2I4_ASPEC|nr:uncharacterized protein BO83DRAFT_406203 [Aspergillus eucalypticola CBS 122712]PWY80099.1 hypothetical protein BO83DRAFT_406203 [Aspergillus eucalypticola CBS 122712]